MKSSTQRGYGYAWQQLRERALKRDQYLCASCRARGRICPAKEVDHIQRKADGGKDELSNLQSLCTDCHKAKTARENGSKTIACDVNGYPINPTHH